MVYLDEDGVPSQTSMAIWVVKTCHDLFHGLDLEVVVMCLLMSVTEKNDG